MIYMALPNNSFGLMITTVVILKSLDIELIKQPKLAKQGKIGGEI